MAGDALPRLITPVPGPKSRALARQLHRYESRNVTYISPHWPVFWHRAAGANVWDVDGNRYLDLTAAFGVAGVGHTNPRVTAAIRRQSGALIHAMGDVHPNALKIRLARELVALTFGRWSKAGGRVVFGNSGAEAVEIALKTTAIYTKHPGIIAFSGGYHGLTFGALAATARGDFRAPFVKQLGRFVTHVPFGQVPKPVRNCGAVLVEPIQGRGGIVVPPESFLPGLRRFCDRYGMLLILDEIYTGFCRTGRWFACEHTGVIPDIICLGKSMTGGVPISACVGRADVMDRWPESTGEALHTSTFLGNPLACAASLAAIGEMKRLKLAQRAEKLGQLIRTSSQGCGLMRGLPVENAPRLCEQLLRRGILALPEGEHGDVLGITPPLTITERQLTFAMETIRELIQ